MPVGSLLACDEQRDTQRAKPTALNRMLGQMILGVCCNLPKRPIPFREPHFSKLRLVSSRSHVFLLGCCTETAGVADGHETGRNHCVLVEGARRKRRSNRSYKRICANSLSVLFLGDFLPPQHCTPALPPVPSLTKERERLRFTRGV